MAMMTGQFERVAETVARRTADLLRAPVTVVDERGITVARGAADNGTAVLGERPAEYLRVPLRLEGRRAEVVIGAPGEGEISPRLAHALIEMVIDQTAVVDRLPSQHELKNTFILDLLRGEIADETDIYREGQILGMDLTRPRAVILIDAADYILASDRLPGLIGTKAQSPAVLPRARLVIDSVVSFFALPSDAICAYIGDGEVVMLKASGTQDLAAWTEREASPDDAHPSWANLAALKRACAELLPRVQRDTGSTVSVGIGRYHRGLRGLARSYADARAALSLGRQLHGRDRVHCLDNLGVAALVGIADEVTKMGLATHLLSPLDHEPELLETLNVFFARDCSPSETSRQLAIHRNTLGYRLEKIASLTGLDPHHFDDAVQIRLALVLRSLQGKNPAVHPPNGMSLSR